MEAKDLQRAKEEDISSLFNSLRLSMAGTKIPPENSDTEQAKRTEWSRGNIFLTVYQPEYTQCQPWQRIQKLLEKI